MTSGTKFIKYRVLISP